ncbi:EAL domain-containing protein [Photobacterium damselae]|uniref:EAL domain-containing protein n=1 Tax=Photobacterium damselae TaxID=38293 RepID=UPI0039C13E9A
MIVHFFELNNKRKLIIKNIIDLCHNLGVRLIVEGIETQSQETLLKDMGVKFFQGYLYSRPSKTMGLFSKII